MLDATSPSALLEWSFLSDLAVSSIPPLMLLMDAPEPTVKPSSSPNEIELGMVGHKVVLSLAMDDVTVLHSMQKGDNLLLLRRVLEEALIKDVKRLVVF
jgi:hypothetical protein